MFLRFKLDIFSSKPKGLFYLTYILYYNPTSFTSIFCPNVKDFFVQFAQRFFSQLNQVRRVQVRKQVQIL